MSRVKVLEKLLQALRGLAKEKPAKEALDNANKAKEALDKAKKAKDAADKAKDAADKLKKVEDAKKKADAAKKAGKEKTECGKGKKKCEDKCPYCGRARHDTKYRRDMAERKKALLRDAKDPNSGLSPEARKFIIASGGDNVPPNHEVSHEKPLYTKPYSKRCTLDKAWNMKTQPKPEHRVRHEKCGDQYHQFPKKK